MTTGAVSPQKNNCSSVLSSSQWYLDKILLIKQNKWLLFEAAPWGNNKSQFSYLAADRLLKFYCRICWHLAKVRFVFRILSSCTSAKDRLIMSVCYTYSVKEYFKMSICVFRRKARIEIFILFSLDNTFSRVPYATSSHDSERSNPSSQLWEWLDTWATGHRACTTALLLYNTKSRRRLPSENGHPLKWYHVKCSVPSMERTKI